MADTSSEIRGFKAVFTGIGLLYMAMASLYLVQGAKVLGEFGIAESLIAEPLVQDLFSFFYLLMCVVGALTVLIGHVTHTRATQTLVASLFFALNLLFAARDLSTSDSRFGNHLYHGEKTVVFVYISLSLAFAYGWLAIRGLQKPAPVSQSGSPAAGGAP